MPECNNSLKDISSEIQQYFLSRDGWHGNDDMKKDKLNPSVIGELNILSSPLHDRGHVHRSKSCRATTTKKARGKESSKHFGVRFRPDLNKWVAEIRVAEWKTVDKKVWLGTFETEVGAARAVDAARKLLQCTKKRPPNFPCLGLDAYSEQIPPHLNLNHLGNDAMFKDVTLFIKRKAQEYAASFCTPSNNNCGSLSRSKRVSVIDETSFCSQPELPYVNLQEGMSLDSQESFSSYENWVDDNALPLREAEVADDHWQQLNVGQRCNFSSVESFYKNDFSDLIYCNQDHEAINALHSSWEDQKFFPNEMGEEYVMLDNILVGSEYRYPFPSDNQEYCAQDQTSMDIISGDEMSHDSCSLFSDLSFQKPSSGTVDSSMDWMLPQLPSYNCFLMSSLDYTQVF